MKAIEQIGLGFLVSTVFMCLVAGGVEDAFMILLVSIVCTAGIGLVVWIPTWWAVGWIVLKLVLAFRGPADDDGTNGPTQVSTTSRDLTSEESSLLHFLQSAQARGIDNARIEKALLGAGWTEPEIQQARLVLQSSAANA